VTNRRQRVGIVIALLAAFASQAVHAQESKVDEDAEPKAMEWLHVTAGLGYKRVLLRTFFAEDSDTERLTADIVPEDMSGPAASLGLFTKLWFIGLGVNARVAELSGAASERGTTDLTLWSFDAEMTFRAPLDDFEPYILFAGGYSTFGGLGDLADGLEQGLDVDGFSVRSGIGLDYYLHRNFSLRVLAAGDLLFLARKGVPVSQLAEPEEVGTLNEAEARLLEADGSSAGLAYDLSLGLGVHF
jgi:hypothetical protein